MIKKVRKLTSERTQLMEEIAEERVEKNRVSLRTEMEGLRKEVAEGIKSRDGADDVRKEQRLADLDRVVKDVEKMFSSQQESFKSGL